MKILKAMLVLAVLAAAAAGAFVYSGIYNIAADVPHTKLVYSALDTLRDRSVEWRASGIQVPPLDDPKLIADGAAHYAEMCSGCHLAPGMEDTELRAGLYPQPPKLAENSDVEPAEAFWIIKHGLKLSAMPAWGATHDDQAIWALVAFLKKLPTLTPQQYEQMTANGEEGHEHRHAQERNH